VIVHGIQRASERHAMRRCGSAHASQNRVSHEKHKNREKPVGKRLSPVFSCLLVFFVAISLGWGQPLPAGSRLILLDGSAVPIQSLQIAGGKLRGESVPADLALDDLRRIEVAEPAVAATEKPALVAELRGGGRIFAKSVAIADDQCRLEWAGGEPLSLPVDLVRAIRCEPAMASTDFDKALAAPSAELDRIFVKDESGQISSVAGVVKSLAAHELTLEVGGQNRQVPRAKLFGIVIAQPTASDPAPRCLLTLNDGSQLGGEELSLAEGRAEVSVPGGGTVKLSWSAVSRVTIRSRRVAYLSDLKPTADQQQPIVTLSRPWQRDRAITGQPILLAGRSYEKGIGVHSRSLLTFSAEKQWDTLAATIGLDSASGSKGDCIFLVLADGQPLFTRRMTGSDPPEEISLAISGREQITLLVEPGEGLDLADHANWGDVRFIKNRE
jgi:hypothetical protein